MKTKLFKVFWISFFLLLNSCKQSPKKGKKGNSEAAAAESQTLSTSSQIPGNVNSSENNESNTPDESTSNSEESTNKLDDPLFNESWHLINSGQNSFAYLSGVEGFDINLGTESQKYSGEGIKIVVSDSGIDLEHEDLKENLIGSSHRNYDYFNDKTNSEWRNPTPKNPDNGDHGTSVSGLIGAVKNNGLGSRGVAPKSKIAAFKFIGINNSSSDIVYDVEVPGDGESFDIYNRSWGLAPEENDRLPQIKLDYDYRDILKYGVQNLRGGLGAIYLKAGGNEFAYAIDSNMDPGSAIPFQIVVGAMNASGERSSYSNIGANLWIVAPGGESGLNNDDNRDEPEYYPAMVTVDYSGCAKGYSKSSSSQNSFEKGSDPNNQNCNYTSTFNGTSSASPVAAGGIALILEAANKLGKQLSWRDVRDILAKTSKKIGIGGQVEHPNELAGPSDYQYDPGWITNKAGFQFSNEFGFGLLQVEKAIEAIPDHTPLKEFFDLIDDGNWKYSKEALNINIPDFDANGISSTLNVSDEGIVENVEIEFSANHEYPGDLGIELISPSGTKSILLHINNFYKPTAIEDCYLTSNAFYGEPMNGNWTIKVIDGKENSTGSFTGWKLNIIGRDN